MISRTFITTLAIWTLCLAPFLCGMGILAHTCICEDSTECRHELDCSADPCQILALDSTIQSSRTGVTIIPVDQPNPTVLMNDVLTQPVMRQEFVFNPVDNLLKEAFPDRCLPLLC